MNQPTQHQTRKNDLLSKALMLLALLCWSSAALAQTLSDLLIVMDEDGIGYTGQQTLFADDVPVVIRLPSGRQTLQTVFSGPGSALHMRAYESDPDRLTLESGSVFTRFRHRFHQQVASEASEPNTVAVASPLSATMTQYDTMMAIADALTYRVTWLLPANFELLGYSADQDAKTDGVGSWTEDDNRVTYEQIGGVPTQMTINYLVHRDSPSLKNACLASVGPSEWCSPDTDLDRVPDYRDLCIAIMDTEKQLTSDDESNTVLDISPSGEPSDEPTASPSNAEIPENSLGCPDNTLIVLPDIQFESGQTYLNAKSRSALGVVAAALQRMPDKLFLIATHTDNAGYVSTNQLLSENRADAIRHYLMLRGVSPNQIQARGYGETSPVHDNRTAAGRRANRRVELRQLD